MAKKTGYEQAAEADAQANGPTSGSPVPETEPIRMKRTKKSPRPVAADVRAINRIDAILEGLPPNVAMRVLRFCQDKQDDRLTVNFMMPPPFPDPKRDARREPGGDLFTPPLPGLDDRDHG
jgi:hypothetical protein